MGEGVPKEKVLGPEERSLPFTPRQGLPWLGRAGDGLGNDRWLFWAAKLPHSQELDMEACSHLIHVASDRVSRELRELVCSLGPSNTRTLQLFTNSY